MNTINKEECNEINIIHRIVARTYLGICAMLAVVNSPALAQNISLAPDSINDNSYILAFSDNYPTHKAQGEIRSNVKSGATIKAPTTNPRSPRQVPTIEASSWIDAGMDIQTNITHPSIPVANQPPPRINGNIN